MKMSMAVRIEKDLLTALQGVASNTTVSKLLSAKLKEYTTPGANPPFHSRKSGFVTTTLTMDVDLATSLSSLSKELHVPVAKIIEQAARDITHH